MCITRCFNSQPPEGGWLTRIAFHAGQALFQLTAARRRLGAAARSRAIICRCFNSQPPEGGWLSHTKNRGLFWSFNSQPPEGGWAQSVRRMVFHGRFNSQPPEGGWLSDEVVRMIGHFVSTHSRPKAAGGWCDHVCVYACEFQLTAARRRLA